MRHALIEEICNIRGTYFSRQPLSAHTTFDLAYATRPLCTPKYCLYFFVGYVCFLFLLLIADLRFYYPTCRR